MNLKDFVDSLHGNPLLELIVWRDNCLHNIAFMSKDTFIKSPKFNQYADIGVNDYTKAGRDYIIYLVI